MRTVWVKKKACPDCNYTWQLSAECKRSEEQCPHCEREVYPLTVVVLELLDVAAHRADSIEAVEAY